MFLFNLSKRFLEIEERNKRFWKFWGDDSKVQNSLIKLFQKHGMDVDKLKMTQITYEMTEKVVIDVRNQFPEAFSYEQIQIVMEKIKEKMEVDKISTLQKHRK
jgi:glycine cleavage system regulatory protein